MTIKFGWCLDKRHEECRRFTLLCRENDTTETLIGLTCDCHCHNESEPTP